MSASEFAYDEIIQIAGYRIYWIAKRHKHLVKNQGWKRLWIEKRTAHGGWKIVYGQRK